MVACVLEWEAMGPCSWDAEKVVVGDRVEQGSGCKEFTVMASHLDFFSDYYREVSEGFSQVT